MRLFFGVSSVLVVPLAALLFAQWPLRDWVQAGSILVNDVAQILFALYVAVAVTAASRANAHLASFTAPLSPTRRRAVWRAVGLLLCLGPWALFLLWSFAPILAASLFGLERFPESADPAYFVIKLALALMDALVLMDLVLNCRASWLHKA